MCLRRTHGSSLSYQRRGSPLGSREHRGRHRRPSVESTRRARTTHPPPEPRGVAPPLTEGTAVRACRRRADRFTALAHDRGTSRARAARRTHRSDGTPGTARRRSPRCPIGGTRAGTASSRSPWAHREPIRLDALSPFARCRMTETATTPGVISGTRSGDWLPPVWRRSRCPAAIRARACLGNVEKKRNETETRAGSLPEALREGIDQLEERSET